MTNPEPTPTEALELLKQFIAHPGIRCFNLQEFQTGDAGHCDFGEGDCSRAS